MVGLALDRLSLVILAVLIVVPPWIFGGTLAETQVWLIGGALLALSLALLGRLLSRDTASSYLSLDCGSCSGGHPAHSAQPGSASTPFGAGMELANRSVDRRSKPIDDHGTS